MSAFAAVAELALGETDIAEASELPSGPVSPFNVLATVVSQYANSPVILELIARLAECIDPTAKLDSFYSLIWNVDTAQGYGLDVWGRIVGVSRVLQIPLATPYFGFSEASDAHSLNEAIFYGGGVATSNYALSDAAYRRLILAKALANITDGSVRSINQILMALFASYGNCYCTDGGDMTMAYHFGARLSPVDRAIVQQSGVLPRPAGVSVTIVEP